MVFIYPKLFCLICFPHGLVLRVCGFPIATRLLMDTQTRKNNRKWKILCWNVRGINSQVKLTTIRNKILETNYDIICLQEIKKRFVIKVSLESFVPHPLIVSNS
jgi:hypothetical protein